MSASDIRGYAFSRVSLSLTRATAAARIGIEPKSSPCSIIRKALAHDGFLLPDPQGERHRVDDQANHQRDERVQGQGVADQLRQDVEEVVRVTNASEQRVRDQRVVTR